jgi:hypothetical protein
MQFGFEDIQQYIKEGYLRRNKQVSIVNTVLEVGHAAPNSPTCSLEASTPHSDVLIPWVYFCLLYHGQRQCHS